MIKSIGAIILAILFIPVGILIFATTGTKELRERVKWLKGEQDGKLNHPFAVWFLITPSRIVRWTIIGTIIIATTKFIVEVTK